MVREIHPDGKIMGAVVAARLERKRLERQRPPHGQVRRARLVKVDRIAGLVQRFHLDERGTVIAAGPEGHRRG